MAIQKEKFKTKAAKQSLNKWEMDCQECGHPFEGKDVNINSTMAKCSKCGTVYFLDDKEFFLGDRKGRPEMMIPEGTEVLHLPSSLDIRIRRLRSASKAELSFKVVFTLVWNLILFSAAAGMIFGGVFGPLLFMLGHFAVGLGMLINLGMILFNYTDVIVDDRYLEISSKPISGFWNRPKRYDKKSIEQLYVSRYVASTSNGNANHAYALYAILDSGKKIRLIKGMNKETQLYIEQELERFLVIKDERVKGEVVS